MLRCVSFESLCVTRDEDGDNQNKRQWTMMQNIVVNSKYLIDRFDWNQIAASVVVFEIVVIVTPSSISFSV